MSFGLRLKKYPKAEIEQRVQEAARILDITELLERKPRQLSGGQRQRVAMGRAIVRNPKVFLFDEPLSNLDAKLRVQMRTEIKRVHQKVRTTTVYVTHDQVEAMTLADRVVVMNQRQDRADRRAELPLPLAGDALRRGLHRLAGDELHSVQAGAGGRGPERAALRHDRLRGAGRARAALSLACRARTLTFGIRPEHLTEAKTNGSKNLATFDAGIEVVEPMGNETMVFFTIDGTEVCGAHRSERRRASVGAPMKMAAHLDNMHLIDNASGKVL